MEIFIGIYLIGALFMTLAWHLAWKFVRRQSFSFDVEIKKSVDYIIENRYKIYSIILFWPAGVVVFCIAAYKVYKR